MQASNARQSDLERFLKIESLKPIEVDDKPISVSKAKDIYQKLRIVQNIHDELKANFINELFRKIGRYRNSTELLKTIPKLKELFEGSIYAYSEDEKYPDRHYNILAYHHYVNKVKIGSKDYFIRFNIKEIKTKEDNIVIYQLHNIALCSIEMTKTNNFTRTTGIIQPASDKAISYDKSLIEWFNKVKPGKEIALVKERSFLKHKLQFLTLTNISNFLKHYFGGIYHRADEHHIFLFGGGLAFSLFVCIIPLVLIIFSILGAILDSATVEQQINSFIKTIIPYKEYAEYAKKIVFSRIEEVVAYKNIAGIIGGFGLLFAASGLFSSMRTIMNRIFVAKEDKHVVIGKLRDLGMILLVILFILLNIILLPALDILKDVTHRFAFLNYFQLSSFEHIFISVISFLMIFLIFYVLYSFVPYAKLGRKIPALSAFWATFLWEIAKRLFGYYLNNIASLDRIYGTYALIIVVAFWIYYSSILFILGAEIGQLYRERLVQKYGGIK